MNLPFEDTILVRATRTLQILVGGMLFGAVFFLLVAMTTFGAHAKSELAEDAPAGSKKIMTAKAIPVLTRIAIGTEGEDREDRVVKGIRGTDGDRPELTLDQELQHAHEAGEPVERFRPEVGSALGPVLLAITGILALLCGIVERRAQQRMIQLNRSRRQGAASTEDQPSHDEHAAALAVVFQQRTLLVAGFIEIGVLLHLVSYLITLHTLLLVSSLTLLTLLAGHFPTVSRMKHWLHKQQEPAEPT